MTVNLLVWRILIFTLVVINLGINTILTETFSLSLGLSLFLLLHEASHRYLGTAAIQNEKRGKAQEKHPGDNGEQYNHNFLHLSYYDFGLLLPRY